MAWRDEASPAFPLSVVDDGAVSNETRLGAVRDLALAIARSELDLGSSEAIDAWLVLACDNLFEFDLSRLLEGFARSGCGQLVVRTVPTPVPPGRYSEVALDDAGRRVTRFREKPADPKSNLSAIAVYLFPADLPERVAEHLEGGGHGDAPGHFLAWLATRTPLEAHRLEGRWLDIGSREDLERAGWTPE
jgi:glucose-1-phosphate thymidylyltransferase